jgi:hypothetical protein
MARSETVEPLEPAEDTIATVLAGKVLAPAFAAALRRGFLAEDGEELSLTDTGRREIAGLVQARRAWLARELSDWGAEDDALLGEALDNLARRMLEQDPELEPV